MSTNIVRTSGNVTSIQRVKIRRGFAFGLILIGALIMFEVFNFSSTEYALSDLLGDLSFLGIRWATILAIAFCGIDFAGIARLNTPETESSRPHETWYLFGAWLLAATMNALLTWWAVSLAIFNHQSVGSEVIDQQTILRVVPIFVAVLVWLIRMLIIGTYSTAGARLLSQSDQTQIKKGNSQVQQPGTSRSLGYSSTNYNTTSRKNQPVQVDPDEDDPGLGSNYPQAVRTATPVAAKSTSNTPQRSRF
jgi:hypothetical protein